MCRSKRRSGACANLAKPKYFGKDWPSRHLYHLTINSAVGDDVVVRTILDEMEALKWGALGALRTGPRAR